MVTVQRVLTMAMLGAAPAAVAEWNQFRGPNGSGLAPAGARPPVRIGEQTLAWKTPLPAGLSSPVVGGGRIFLTALEGERLLTIAIDEAAGDEIWRRAAPGTATERVHQTSSPAASTPLLVGGRLFVYFGSFGLICYDLDGDEIWRRAIPTPESLYGMSTSPIPCGDTLILVLDDQGDLPGSKLSRSRVVAFRQSDGETEWETPRPLVRSGWSTPAIWRHAGGDELVVLGSGHAHGYDPGSGEERWFATGFSRETIAVPVTGDGKVFFASAQLGGGADEEIDPEPFWRAILQFDRDGDGRLDPGEMTEHFTYPLRPELPVGHPGFGIPLPGDPERRRERQRGVFGWVDRDRDGFWTRREWEDHLAAKRNRPILMAVRPGGEGNIDDSHVVWELNRSVPEVPSPIYFGGRIYMVRNGGLIAAVDAESGDLIYRERTRGGGGYTASPVAAGGHLYVVSERGQISVVKAGNAFDEVHFHELGEAVRVTPAINGNTIYFRSASHLWAFRRP